MTSGIRMPAIDDRPWPALSNWAAPRPHSAPWTTWAILASIETDAGNPDAAAAAQRKAIAGYLDYRRAGGANHDGDGRLGLAVTQPPLAGDPAQAAALLPFSRTLQAIVNGSRDRRLADASDLRDTMAAEILLLIDALDDALKQSGR